MKKSLILPILTVVFFALSGVAMAGNPPNAVTIYGNFRYSLNSINEDGVGTNIDGIQGQDNISLFGVKGEYGNDGIIAFFHLQTQAFADGDAAGRAFKQRFYYGGLKGNFGKVSFGRMTNAYKFPGFVMDPFYNLSHISAGGAYAAGGATYGLSSATNGFTDNALQYESMNIGGFKLVGGLYIDDSNENDHGYIAGGSYNTGGFTIGGISAMNDKAVATIPGVDPDGNAIRSYATYNRKNLKIGISYENVDTGDGNANFIYATSTVIIEDINTDFSVSAGVVDAEAIEGFGITAGVFYTIVENARLFTLMSYANLDSDSNPFVISIGANFNFNLFVD
ncbi:porin [candidate division KSB1 bacterium]|nr:porin [candidate division KSB1 bacterium]